MYVGVCSRRPHCTAAPCNVHLNKVFLLDSGRTFMLIASLNSLMYHPGLVRLMSPSNVRPAAFTASVASFHIEVVDTLEYLARSTNPVSSGELDSSDLLSVAFPLFSPAFPVFSRCRFCAVICVSTSRCSTTTFSSRSCCSFDLSSRIWSCIY